MHWRTFWHLASSSYSKTWIPHKPYLFQDKYSCTTAYAIYIHMYLNTKTNLEASAFHCVWMFVFWKNKTWIRQLDCNKLWQWRLHTCTGFISKTRLDLFKCQSGAAFPLSIAIQDLDDVWMWSVLCRECVGFIKIICRKKLVFCTDTHTSGHTEKERENADQP